MRPDCMSQSDAQGMRLTSLAASVETVAQVFADSPSILVLIVWLASQQQAWLRAVEMQVTG